MGSRYKPLIHLPVHGRREAFGGLHIGQLSQRGRDLPQLLDNVAKNLHRLETLLKNLQRERASLRE